MLRGLFLACVVVGLAGCGQKGVLLQGDLVRDDVPYFPEEKEHLEIIFHRLEADGSGQTFAAQLSPGTSRFKVMGLDGGGLPLGDYKIAIGSFTYGEEGATDRFAGAFSPENSPLQFSLTRDVLGITIDLARKTVGVSSAP